MLNDFHRPMLVAILCIPLLAGLAVVTLFGRVISAIRWKHPVSTDGLLFHLIAIVVLAAAATIIIIRTWHLPDDRRLLGLNRRGWRIGVVFMLALGVLFGLASTYLAQIS
jgi:hypothetical protein